MTRPHAALPEPLSGPDLWFIRLALQSGVARAGAFAVLARGQLGSANAAPAQPARGTPTHPDKESKGRGAQAPAPGKPESAGPSLLLRGTGGAAIPGSGMRGSTAERARPAVGDFVSTPWPSCG